MLGSSTSNMHPLLGARASSFAPYTANAELIILRQFFALNADEDVRAPKSLS